MMSHSSNSSGYHAVGYGDQTSRAGSSSNPPLRQNYDYEVFLSFSGKDTRYSFCDHLHHKLIDRGISVFRDREALIVGQKIDQLLEAIKASKILIPIISLHYASSEWCLRELVQILKCHKPPTQLVLPIFYKVKPSDVREQKGEFGDEFERFKARADGESELVQDSEQAFEKVALLKGWELKNENGYEAELVKSIVTRIFEVLRDPLKVPDYLVGVEEHVEKIKEKIDAKQSKGAMFIVIHGMGGIGKTTLSKVLYNKLCIHYESCSFVPNIREASSHPRGMENMQKQIISDVVVDRSIQEIRHVDEGISLIERSFRGKRILLLLDDVGSKDQLNKLAGENNWSESDSIIIVTTRNRGVAVASADNLSYELTELDDDRSYALFSKHAFATDASCPSDLEFLARDIVGTTGGLPLALEVIGSLLRGQSKAVWEGTLQKLRKTLDNGVRERLKISYDALTYEQKQIFLDIACLSFNSQYAHYMWKSCYFYPEQEIEQLISLSLIKKERGIWLTMHDQLRDLGRTIVLEEDRHNIGGRSRIWEAKEALEMMEQMQGTSKVEALRLRNFSLDINWTSRQFEGMRNLRFLHMGDVSLAGDFQNCFPNLKSLIWYFSERRPPGEIEHLRFNLKELVTLELDRVNITEHWNCWSQMKYLKVLQIRGCSSLTTTPDFSALEGLEILTLFECWELGKIHPSIGKFSKTLKELNLTECKELKELPIELGKMEELRVLILEDISIREIPIFEGYMTKLEQLSLERCKELEFLPNLPSSLLFLHFHGDSMETLPDFSNLTNLYELTYKDSFERRNKALNLRNLDKLQILNIHRTIIFDTDTDTWCYFDSEDEVEIANPADEIDLTLGNIGLQLELPISLVELHVTRCQTLHNFPNLSNMRNLSKISLWACSRLMEISGLEGAESLEHLAIQRCRKLSRIGDLSHLKMLETLRLCDCEKLTEIRGLENLTSLGSLDLTGCIAFKERPYLPNVSIKLDSSKEENRIKKKARGDSNPGAKKKAK